MNVKANVLFLISFLLLVILLVVHQKNSVPSPTDHRRENLSHFYETGALTQILGGRQRPELLSLALER